MSWFDRECKQLSKMASIYAKRGKYPQAENSYRLVIDMLEKNDEAYSLDLALAYFRLAELYSDQCKFSEAAPYYRRAVFVYQKVFPNEGTSALWYSIVLMKIQKLAEAEAAPAVVENDELEATG